MNEMKNLKSPGCYAGRLLPHIVFDCSPVSCADANELCYCCHSARSQGTGHTFPRREDGNLVIDCDAREACCQSRNLAMAVDLSSQIPY